MTGSRLRMIAGPNGSGKSTSVLQFLKPEWLGKYVNPDDMEKRILQTGLFRFEEWGIRTHPEEVRGFFQASSLLREHGYTDEAGKLSVKNDELSFADMLKKETFGYLVPVLADFVRQKLMENRESFTFETVMSHSSKVDLLRRAQAEGYRTYLYYVATDDPELNVERVAQRVLSKKGHFVEPKKVRERYHRSLDLLLDAIRNVNRAYIFDNSGKEASFIAEIGEGADPSEGQVISLKVDELPAWFYQAVLAKLP